MVSKRSTDTPETDFSVDRKFSFTVRDFVTAVISIISVCGVGAGYQVIAKPAESAVIDEATKVDLEIMQKMHDRDIRDSFQRKEIIDGQAEIKVQLNEIKDYLKNPRRVQTDYGPLSMVSK